MYGFDMSAFGESIVRREREKRRKPEIISLGPGEILSEPQVYMEFDLLAVKQTDLNLINKTHFVSISQVRE